MVESHLRHWRFLCQKGALLLVLAATVAVALVAATTASGLPSRFDTGVYDPRGDQGGEGQSYSSLRINTALYKVQTSRAKLVRIPLNWNRVACSAVAAPCRQARRPRNPTNPNDPAYAWARGGWYDYQTEIRSALARGLKPVISVFGAPAWAECDGRGSRTKGILSCTGKVDMANYKPNAAAVANFMVAVSKKFRRVHYFQIWNEPNGGLFLAPGGREASIDRYRNMVNRSYAALHRLPRYYSAGDRVIAGGTSPNSRATTFSPMRFVTDLVSKRVKFDIYSTHPYTPGGPQTRAPASTKSVWMGNLGQVNKVLRSAKRRGKIVGHPLRFWATEMSWDSAPPDCGPGRPGFRPGKYAAVPAALHTRWVSEAPYRMWRQGVSAMIWTQLKDNPATLSAYQGGLFRWGGNGKVGAAKGALRALRFPFVALERTRGAYVWGRLPSGKAGKVLIQRRVGHSWRKVKTFKTSSTGLFKRRMYFSLRGVDAVRARVPGSRILVSVAFALQAPPTPRGIQPLGCTNKGQW